MLNQELGEPFRRDAMKKPDVVAGIRREECGRSAPSDQAGDSAMPLNQTGRPIDDVIQSSCD